MSTMVKIPPMRPEPERDRYGRYVLPDANGNLRSWTRATTVVGALKDLNGLIGWKRRKVAEGLAIQPGLLGRVAELAAAVEAATDWRDAKEAKAAFDELCDEAAHAAGADRGSEAGTQAHTLTEYADAGRLDEVRHLATESELADLQAYLDTCDAAGIIRPPQWIERIITNSVTDSAGTLDRIVDVQRPCGRCGGHLRIADVKSQQSVDFGWMEICCQLGQYANADGIVGEDGRLEPLPDGLCRCTGIVMHVPVGKATCDLYEIDLVVGWQAAQIAAEVRRLRSASKTFGWPYAPTRPAAGDRVLTLIESAGHPDALTALWRDLDPRGEWTPVHTAAARAKKARLLATAS